MNVRFFIRTTKKSKEKPVKIRVRLRDGEAIDLYGNTGQIISPDKWNAKRERPKFNAFTGSDTSEYDRLNGLLNDLDQAIRKAYNHVPVKHELGNDWLQDIIDRTLYPENYDQHLSLFKFIEKFIFDSQTKPNPKTGRPVSYKQRRLYEQTYNDLKAFCEQERNGKELEWNDIDLDFYHDYMNYLNTKKIKNKDGRVVQTGLATNTIGKRIQTVKIFLNAANDAGYEVNQAFKSHRFKALSEESQSIYLNESELQMMFDYDFSDKPRLEKVRDLFMVAAWTGLRFGDITRLTRENIGDNDYIYTKQGKTGDPVVIPLHETVKFILDKYDGDLPEPISNQKFNDYLKESCRIVGINERVHKAITIGGKQRSKSYEKWELVSAHTGRRSFATNLYLQGFPSLSIMKITGHTTETSFLKYIKVTPREHAEKLKEFWRQRGEHLRVENG